MMLQVQDLGNSSYKRTWELQKELQLQRIENNIDDTLLLVEHEPVYTFGKNADENHLLQNYPEVVILFVIPRCVYRKNFLNLGLVASLMQTLSHGIQSRFHNSFR